MVAQSKTVVVVVVVVVVKFRRLTSAKVRRVSIAPQLGRKVKVLLGCKSRLSQQSANRAACHCPPKMKRQRVHMSDYD